MKSNSPSEYWKTVRELSPSSDDGMVLMENGVKITDEKEIGDIINPFFKEKVEGIEREIPYKNISPTQKLEDNLEGKNLSFSLKTVSEKQVEKAIKSLKNKNSSGVDFISPKIIKLAADIIKKPLHHISNIVFL